MATHLIHSQVLDLRYSNERRAKAAMDQWSDRFQAIWQPIIEEVLDELDTEGKWIRIERVEVDLGKIRENLAPELFRQKLKEALKTQLLRQIPEKSFSESLGKNPGLAYPQDDRKPLELLIYLLKNGRKPWWASHSKKENIRSLVRKLTQENPREFSAWLQTASLTPTMLLRLENHLPTNEIREILQLGFSEKQKQGIILIQSLATALSPEIHAQTELEKKWEKSMLQAFFLPENQLQDPISGWIKTNLGLSSSPATSFLPSSEALTELFGLLLPKGYTLLSKLPILEKAWTKWIQTPVYKKARPSKSSLASTQSTEVVKFIEWVKTGFLTKEKTASHHSDQLAQDKLGGKSAVVSTSEKLVLDETIPVSNAGLVLAAPFLPYFFKGLGLVENKQFVSPEAQNRGVLLLQALLDDSFSYEESDLVLNKIICGIDPSEPIEVRFVPSELEREEIKNLLNAMVSQWSALKSTSGESMAKGFFSREGSLKRTGRGYQLTVPRLSIDILLNRLPWAISIIKLSWMNETLFTEW
jgi:hypothetical protein